MLLTFLGKNNGAAPEIIALKTYGTAAQSRLGILDFLSLHRARKCKFACGTLLGLNNLHVGVAKGA